MTDARTERARQYLAAIKSEGLAIDEAEIAAAFAQVEVENALEEAADAAREKCYQYDQHALGVLVDGKIRALKEGKAS